MRHCLGRGGVALLVSSDIPGVPAGALHRAVALLGEGVDVVLGPGHDGGYWLIGVREQHPGLFDGIPWSTAAVLEATLARCRELSLDVRLLEPWRDIDTMRRCGGPRRRAGDPAGTADGGGARPPRRDGPRRTSKLDPRAHPHDRGGTRTMSVIPSVSADELVVPLEEIARGAAEADRDGRFPTESIDALRTAGLLGIGVAERFGGPGGSPRGRRPGDRAGRRGVRLDRDDLHDAPRRRADAPGVHAGRGRPARGHAARDRRRRAPDHDRVLGDGHPQPLLGPALDGDLGRRHRHDRRRQVLGHGRCPRRLVRRLPSALPAPPTRS